MQRLYDGDPVTHWERCESEGLQCPQEIFTPLFNEKATAEDFSVIVRSIDWGRVRWELEELSGATQFGIVDDRQEVVDHWRDAKSWIVPPVAVACDLLGGGAGLELLIGYTRLGNLLALLDREEVPEIQKHLVWVGKGTT